MKSSILKWYSLVVLFLVNFVMFAQTAQPDSPDFGNPGGGNTDTEDGSPINTFIVFLAIAGIVFAAQYFRKPSAVKIK
ncbi:hypothetical protein ACLI1A_05870 [Flavobacterium sp. RHBU_3]|uniref:hypothetical protein n=1 Tax=Flavobacterium sp. RHBU_3 TaxID=3391184 RepID=UPI003984ABA3